MLLLLICNYIMGIQRLLPFLENSTRDACISEFENDFVAVDAYCWLHKGIYSCAFELAQHKPTLKYVTYCMRYIEMLCYYKVKPILVFDGRQLSSKSETEKKRREERKRKFERGKELWRAGNIAESKKLLGESVDVTHELAVNLMKECRKKNIDCIVAPYEADAQLAFFSLQNVVKCIITEDSDLLAYGCERVMFKMDTRGYGKLVEKKKLHFSLGMTPEEMNDDTFRYMCILSGCDYLPSLKSIGPKNALKFVKLLRRNDSKNIYDELPKLPIYLNKEKIHVTSEYIQGFKIADKTFQHQLVYDPFRRKQVPLKPVKNDDDIVGEKLPQDEAFQLAVGNIDPITMKKLLDYDPDKFGAGFTILWRSDLLPNAAPRKNIFSSNDRQIETKKRQREGLESDPVFVLSNGLKKPRIPLSITNVKNSFAKHNQKIPANGFIFEPKVLSEKIGSLRIANESTLLCSRYFAAGKLKQTDSKPLAVTDYVNVKRKNESDEEYSRRLFQENCWVDEEEKPEPCSCSEGSSQSENHCISCSKCSGCCSCLSAQAESESQESDQKPSEVEKSKEPVQHSLLDEIYKNEEESKEQSNRSGHRTPSPIQSSQYYKILPKIISAETCEEIDWEGRENSDKETISEAVNRSPSPVFITQKTNSSSKLEKISDTTATPTSVYFSFEDSNKTPQVSKINGSASQRKLGARASGGVISKSWRKCVKNPSVHKTLFDFGFQKRDKDVNR